MDPATDLPDRIEDLEANIDELEAILSPLLSAPLPTTASTLPLLDKAKLHILSAYAIESLLFSSLLASGIDAKSHPIFKELGRLKSYFGKIKDAEAGPEKRVGVDKEAAKRFIKHGLSGNDRYDKERRERERLQRVKEAEKRVNVKFDQHEESARMDKQLAKKRTADAVENEGSSPDQEQTVDAENRELYGSEEAEAPTSASAKKDKRARKKAKLAAELAEDPTSTNDPTNTTPFETVLSAKEQQRSNRRAKKQASKAEKMAGKEEGKEEEIILPTRAPRTHSETFNALLQGQLPKKPKPKGKGK